MAWVRTSRRASALHVAHDSGTGPAIILLHAIASSSVTFQNVIPLIAARYAARNGRRVSKLVLVSPPIYLAPTELSDGVDRGMLDRQPEAHQYFRLNKTFTLMAARGIQPLLPIPKLVDITERNRT